MRSGERGKCPHCLVVNKFEKVVIEQIGDKQWNSARNNLVSVFDGIAFRNSFDRDVLIILEISRCSCCGKNVIYVNRNMVYLSGSSRSPCPIEVPEAIRQDYIEACLVEPYSKKASAALARRCLQNMLRDNGIKKGDLSKEIDEAMDKLPSHLAESIDAIRHIGNFAAHPIKSSSTGEIVDVEDEEAEWALDVLEYLFDFYYVQPAATKRKKEAMNKKLADLGKPPLKTPTKLPN
jgi:uncharacterized protein Smg (DUF494 family)